MNIIVLLALAPIALTVIYAIFYVVVLLPIAVIGVTVESMRKKRHGQT